MNQPLVSWDEFQEQLLQKCSELAVHLEADGVAIAAAGERLLAGVGWELPLQEDQSMHGIAAGERLVFMFIISGEMEFMNVSEGLLDGQLAAACEWAADTSERFAASSPEHAKLLPLMSDEELERLGAF